MIFWMLIWGPLVLAILAALVLHLLSHQRAPRVHGHRLALLLLAGGIPALVIGLIPPLTFFWGWQTPNDLGMRAVLPLLLGIGAIVVLMLPFPRTSTPAVADLTSRSMTSFTANGWFITLGTVSAVVVLLTVVAGLASTPDEQGLRTMYWISIDGGSSEFGTTIYGWFYSIPSLIALAALVVTALIAWWLISLPPRGYDVKQDAAVRRVHSAGVGRAACGAVLVHLSVILGSLAGTASLRGETRSEEFGLLTIETTFAALEPLLWWSGRAALTAGLTLWVLTAVRTLPKPWARPALSIESAEAQSREDLHLR